MAEWKRGFQQEDFAARMERIRKEGSAGDLFHHLEQNAVLAGMLELNPSVPELERARLLNLATADAAKAPITAETLLRHIRSRESAYLRQPVKQFTVVTGMSVASSLSVPQRVIETSRVRFNPKLSPRAKRVRADVLAHSRGSVIGTFPEHYQTVSVSTKARTASEAIERGLDALDLLRSMWNFALNRAQWARLSSGAARNPVNKLLLHPIHTVHDHTGANAADTWWFDPSYVGPAQGIWEEDKLKRCLALGEVIRRRLRGHPYGDALKGAIRRYGRALDSRDVNDAFLRLWGTIELLTASGSPANYALTARRAAFLYAERDYSLIVMTHLRNQRNRFVHAGVDVGEAEQHLFLLKRYVEALLAFHIHNKFGFRSLDEAGEFLDLPSSKRAIAEKIGRLRQAARFVTSP